MFNVAHVLKPAMVTDLAAYFKDLDPKPLGGAPKELVAAGKKIYEEGVPAPRFLHALAVTDRTPRAPTHFSSGSQLHDYVAKKLLNWSKERGQDTAKPDNSAIMHRSRIA